MLKPISTIPTMIPLQNVPTPLPGKPDQQKYDNLKRINMKKKKILLSVLCICTIAWLIYRISQEGIYRTPENFFHKESKKK
jgi:hypothetical protein